MFAVLFRYAIRVWTCISAVYSCFDVFSFIFVHLEFALLLSFLSVSLSVTLLDVNMRY